MKNTLSAIRINMKHKYKTTTAKTKITANTLPGLVKWLDGKGEDKDAVVTAALIEYRHKYSKKEGDYGQVRSNDKSVLLVG